MYLHRCGDIQPIRRSWWLSSRVTLVYHRKFGSWYWQEGVGRIRWMEKLTLELFGSRVVNITPSGTAIPSLSLVSRWVLVRLIIVFKRASFMAVTKMLWFVYCWLVPSLGLIILPSVSAGRSLCSYLHYVVFTRLWSPSPNSEKRKWNSIYRKDRTYRPMKSPWVFHAHQSIFAMNYDDY